MSKIKYERNEILPKKRPYGTRSERSKTSKMREYENESFKSFKSLKDLKNDISFFESFSLKFNLSKRQEDKLKEEFKNLYLN